MKEGVIWKLSNFAEMRATIFAETCTSSCCSMPNAGTTKAVRTAENKPACGWNLSILSRAGNDGSRTKTKSVSISSEKTFIDCSSCLHA